MSEQNGLATRDSVLAASRRRFTEVVVPGGSRVRIRSITEGERSDWESAMLDPRGRPKRAAMRRWKVGLIVLCVVDADGNPLFSAGDIDGLMQVDSAITNRLFDACQEHCGVSDDDVEALEKNSAATSDAASPSD